MYPAEAYPAMSELENEGIECVFLMAKILLRQCHFLFNWNFNQ